MPHQVRPAPAQVREVRRGEGHLAPPQTGRVVAELLLGLHVTHAQGGAGGRPLADHLAWHLLASLVGLDPLLHHLPHLAVGRLQHLSALLVHTVVLDTGGAAYVGDHPGGVPQQSQPRAGNILEQVKASLSLRLPEAADLLKGLHRLPVDLLRLLQAGDHLGVSPAGPLRHAGVSAGPGDLLVVLVVGLDLLPALVLVTLLHLHHPLLPGPQLDLQAPHCLLINLLLLPALLQEVRHLVDLRGQLGTGLQQNE